MHETPPAILYIDDDEGLRRLTARALRRLGYRVELAAGGAEGVAMAAADRFDLVAVDHYMPGQDGLQTLSALKKLDAPPPVIFVTGSDESQLAVAALKAGAIDYVVKTVNADYFDLLGQAIAQALATVSLRREKEAAEQQLRESHARLEMLLHEVNHRVANSLQLVSAFVHMQARQLDEAESVARAALDDTQRRIAAIAQVHKRLYTSDSVEAVDMADYLASLVDELGETWSTPRAPRHIRLACEPLRLATDKAVALGIIVTELVTNACKYAYPDDGPGEVRVALSDAGEEFALRVEDDGCGMASGAAQGTGLGTRLIRAMAQTLKARLDYAPTERGVHVVLLASQ
ncbi:response regulator [Rhizorhabdus dicambivorans]|uniref:histidine kinase n=1 Tax=Rhizorhabdus dicambivorans TaxID=1850238 RepID=A0A2A4FZ92_9SPHN|nr:response regulator [Rhizorhabdus dicambivorans]ATE63690.1 two-component system sensor histidine kinase/response regulator [Rhizorhabdus dicambivorans]PCE42819.1 two-component system sensor histidine kinase/response regulator [Rhizorhabdus dicambivorans]